MKCKMKKNVFFALAVSVSMLGAVQAQYRERAPQKLDPVVQQFVDEEENNSQLEALAFELLDGIGPRLVGTPEMLQAHDWAVVKLNSWGIDAENQQYGTWKGWQRGITHVDMTYPRTKTLNAMQLAWSPVTKKPVDAEVVILPEVTTKAAFDAWLPSVKGKIILNCCTTIEQCLDLLHHCIDAYLGLYQILVVNYQGQLRLLHQSILCL